MLPNGIVFVILQVLALKAIIFAIHSFSRLEVLPCKLEWRTSRVDMNVVKIVERFFCGNPSLHKHTVKNSWQKLQSFHRSSRKEGNVWYFLKIQRILLCNCQISNPGWVGRSIYPPRPTWRCRHVPKSGNLALPEKELWLKFCFKHKGLFSKPSGKMIVAPNLCFLS